MGNTVEAKKQELREIIQSLPPGALEQLLLMWAETIKNYREQR